MDLLATAQNKTTFEYMLIKKKKINNNFYPFEYEFLVINFSNKYTYRVDIFNICIKIRFLLRKMKTLVLEERTKFCFIKFEFVQE